jgi:hypothetical protein
MINGKNLEHRPISELMAIVKRDLKKINEQGLIDEGACIKTIMYCNDTLGIPVREIREVCIPIEDYKGKLPLDFEKIYYACMNRESKKLSYTARNPFNNKVDADVVYEAKVASGVFGDETKVTININRMEDVEVTEFQNWIQVDVAKISSKHCFKNCPIIGRGKPAIIINDDNTIECPFEKGEIYIMYVANMKDSDGRLLFPFHSKITPWYEWCVKEKIITDAMFNMDGDLNWLRTLKQDCKVERGLAWIDAFNATMDKALGDHAKREREKELKWYNKYFKYFK